MLLTLGHAQICPHNQHQLAFLASILDRRSCGRRIPTSHIFGRRALLLLFAVRRRSHVPLAQPLLLIGLGAVGPVRRVVHHGLIFVDIGFVAVDRIIVIGARLSRELGRDQVAFDAVHAKGKAGDGCDDGSG